MSAQTAGKVHLVGAGPGDPGLLTMKGAELLRNCGAVVYDRLASPELLDLVPASAERVFMGKEPETPGEFQEQINGTLVALAKRGLDVVRLKGGDPFVFGRGGEELEALRAEGIPFDVVPGITSSIAVPAYAGVPVTNRGVAASFTVVTGSEDPTKAKSSLDWPALAKVPGTLVVLMGWRALPAIIEVLTEHGKSPDTPVSVTQWGTLPRQRTVTGTLKDIVQRGNDEGLRSPVVTVIGEVAGLRDQLRWFDTGPLFGTRVLVTRSRQQAGSLSRLLREQGADAVELPTIEITRLEDHGLLDDALTRLAEYGWIIFTSANAVEAVFDRLAAVGRDTRAFGAARVAAIGPATARALRDRGIEADYVPSVFTSEAVADGFRQFDLNRVRVLLPRADIAPNALPKGLRAEGAVVDDLPAYRSGRPADAGDQARGLLASGTITTATFTSSSTVRNLVELLDGDLSLLDGVRIVSIGPVTSATARELGLTIDVEATEHSVPGVVQALLDSAKEKVS